SSLVLLASSRFSRRKRLVICAGMGYAPSEALWAMALLATAALAATTARLSMRLISLSPLVSAGNRDELPPLHSIPHQLRRCGKNINTVHPSHSSSGDAASQRRRLAESRVGSNPVRLRTSKCFLFSARADMARQVADFFTAKCTIE